MATVTRKTGYHSAYGEEEEKRSRNSNDLQGPTRKEEQSGGGKQAQLAQITRRETKAHNSSLHGVQIPLRGKGLFWMIKGV